jgi:hypothetical protein
MNKKRKKKKNPHNVSKSLMPFANPKSAILILIFPSLTFS